jgi:putative flippase GtrA
VKQENEAVVPEGADLPATENVPFSGAPGPLQRLIKDQRILFLLVGGCNTLFSTSLFVVLTIVFGRSVPSAVSLAIAWIVSLLTAFFVYRKLVFRVKGHALRDLARFAGVNLTSLLINAGLLTLLVDVWGLPAIPVQLGVTCIIVVFNYFGHRNYSFRRRHGSAGENN